MSGDNKDLLLYEQKDSESEKETELAALQEALSAALLREAEKDQQIQNLKEQIEFLTKKLFGKKSEESADFPGQINLKDFGNFFNEPEMSQDPRVPDESIFQTEETTDKKRKPRITNQERYKDVPVKKKYLDVPEEERVCPNCGSELEEIGETFVRRELHYIPARMTVIEYYSKTYACPVCREDEESYIVKGSTGNAHLLHGMASPSTIAWIIYQKYMNSMPIDRQAKDWKRLYGLPITTATLCNWVIRNADDYLKPLYEYLHRQLLLRKFLMADETPTQVLHEENRRPQTKSYMWVYRTGEDGEPPIILYHYSETRAGYNAESFLGKYSGYLMCDGYGGYNALKYAVRCSCWAHVRRYLIDAIPKGMQNNYSVPAVQGKLYVDKLFRIEREIHEKYKDPEKIKEARLQKERALLDDFFSWLSDQHPVKGSRMDKAVTYITNRKPFLMNYLEDGRCSFSNNLTEQGCKAYVIGRKNWLFSDSPNGAKASSILYSIVRTAELNGVNVYYYLQYLLTELPKHPNPSDELLAEFVPWNASTKEKIKALYDEDHPSEE